MYPKKWPIYPIELANIPIYTPFNPDPSLVSVATNGARSLPDEAGSSPSYQKGRGKEKRKGTQE